MSQNRNIQLNSQAFDCELVANGYADIAMSLGIILQPDVVGQVLLELVQVSQPLGPSPWPCGQGFCPAPASRAAAAPEVEPVGDVGPEIPRALAAEHHFQGFSAWVFACLCSASSSAGVIVGGGAR